MKYIFTILIGILLSAQALFASEPTCYVVNSLGETLSKVNLTTGFVTNNIVTLGSDIGSAPNQIVIRDTLAYVVNSTTAEIQIINLNTESTVGWINLPPGSNPFHMAFYNDRYAYVTLLIANEVAKVDVNKNKVVSRHSVGLAPGPIVIANHKAYIGITAVDTLFVYHQGELAIFDCIGDSLLQNIPVRTNPNALAVDADYRVHLMCSGDYWSEFCWVYVFDPHTDALVDSLFLGGSPSALAIAPDNKAYASAGGWVSSGEMYVYDAATLTVINDESNPFSVSRGCIGVAVFQNSDVYPIGFNDTVNVISPSGVRLHSYAVGDGPVALDFNYLPGDIDGNWMVSLGDLTALIDILFISLEDPPIKWRANVDGSFNISLGDLTKMIDYLFINPGTSHLSVGPTWIE